MTKYSPMPSLGRLREVFDLDCHQGLIWKAKPHPMSTITVGLPAGSKRKDGYVRVVLDGRRYFAHRIVWYLKHGIDPGEKQIDHINRVKSDNRPGNLRLATNYENAQNRLDPPRTRTGELCVTSSSSKIKPYRVQVKGRYLGLFASLEEACSARDGYMESIRSEFSPTPEDPSRVSNKIEVPVY